MNYRGANHEQPWPEWDTLVYRRHSISKRSRFPLVARHDVCRDAAIRTLLGVKRKWLAHAPHDAEDIADLARRVSPRGDRPASGVKVDVSDIRRGRIISTSQTVNGRRIVVQKRVPFAIHVGELPVKTR
jgi:hypothetical protein